MKLWKHKRLVQSEKQLESSDGNNATTEHARAIWGSVDTASPGQLDKTRQTEQDTEFYAERN